VANWNLARFDRAWQQQHGESAPMFRYADDLLILAREPLEAAGLRRPLARSLRRANRLRLAPGKTRVVTLEQGVPLLGLLVRRHPDAFACRHDVHIFIDPEPFREVLTEIEEWVEHLDADRPLGSQFVRFNQRLRGWFETYQYAYDAAQAFETLDRHLFACLRRRLKVLLGCSASALDRDHHRRLPSGHDTWEADGVALLVLGALPRKYYRPSEVRPPWESDAKPMPTTARPVGDGLIPAPSRLSDEAPLDPILGAMIDQAGTEDTTEVEDAARDQCPGHPPTGATDPEERLHGLVHATPPSHSRPAPPLDREEPAAGAS
jgi:hypothetical protein